VFVLQQLNIIINSKSFTHKLFLLLDPELFLELLFVLVLLFLELLLEMRMAQHVVLAEPVHLEIRIVGHFETFVNNSLFDFHLFGHLLIDDVLYSLFPSFEDIGLLYFVLELVV
jgi:hypothetical protein